MHYVLNLEVSFLLIPSHTTFILFLFLTNPSIYTLLFTLYPQLSIQSWICSSLKLQGNTLLFSPKQRNSADVSVCMCCCVSISDLSSQLFSSGGNGNNTDRGWAKYAHNCCCYDPSQHYQHRRMNEVWRFLWQLFETGFGLFFQAIKTKDY